MSLPENGHPSFKINQAKSVAGQLRTILENAIQAGQGEQFLAAIREIHEKLLREADTFGEALFRLPALGLQMRLGIVFPLAVNFGVNRLNHQVFISFVKSLVPLD